MCDLDPSAITPKTFFSAIHNQMMNIVARFIETIEDISREIG